MDLSIQESATPEVARARGTAVHQPTLTLAKHPALTPRSRLLRRLRRSLSVQVGGFIILLLIILAMFGPVIAQYDPLRQDLTARLQPPSALHWLGTDPLGRDILSRLLYGSRLSLTVGLVVGLIALLVGAPLGVAAGYCGNPLDDLLMRVMDVLLALPGILLAIGIIAALGPGLQNVMIAVGVVTIPSFARIARASTLQTKELLYVEAARNLGGTPIGVMLKHVLPNIASPLIVLFCLRAAFSILTVASLGFLGVGAQPPEPEWGAMLSNGRQYLGSAPHVAIFPGLAIMLVVVGFNLFGDGLRDALQPQMRERAGSR